MLEINLDFIKDQAIKMEEENCEFRSFLKWRTPKNLDRMAAELYQEIAAQIDCGHCGNCCHLLQPVLNNPDMVRLAKILKLSLDEFERQYIDKEQSDTNTIMLKGAPCPFLENNRCRQYADRPKSCMDYPFLTKRGLSFRLIMFMENVGICPIAFHVNERLKRLTGFRFRPKRNFPPQGT